MEVKEKVAHDDESFRDSLSTLDDEGHRKWIFPKRPVGRFYNWRKLVSYVLLTILFGVPFIKIGSEPLLLFNVLERKFVIFGQVFWPQDFHLFVIGMISILVFVILFTVIYGRIFCGWLCPQTIFMEMVFRRIEYVIEGDYMAQKKLKTQDWNGEKIGKKGLKHAIFLAISFLIMHTFMSYIIGVDQVWALMSQAPNANVGGFTAMVFFTGMFYLVFTLIREQVCTNICPYGRLQGVLLDKSSVVVAYDYVRGEGESGRAILRKNEDRTDAGHGDCIDCHQCVQVCPTGIDIRNGTQLECVNCTACIDACDSIMDKVGFDRGLIKYASEDQIVTREPFRLTSRMIAYSGVLTLLLSVLAVLILIRGDIESSILRTPGIMYQEREDGSYSNLYNYKILNKSQNDMPIEIRVLNPKASVQLVGAEISVEHQEIAEGAMFVILEPEAIEGTKTDIKIGIFSNDELVETVKTSFLGPSL
ncbi:MAG: cytochrome c oxidase accessory protein FixG [Cyclobacteriaceae bacterium]|jgi:cytochrome c oxidase accessory protein FixG